ncbi:hypothetical protein BZG36_01760 [Bifiguratus adelaidae]|uniref:Uncharacterized protein n=1 Tax=Bifiguratus adelaidae TaxID=1938954 RepID=A0A261Y308_9FUNG|nr:hypothetical protein BZG36_01760 [Bifiguratus adelaidae]
MRRWRQALGRLQEERETSSQLADQLQQLLNRHKSLQHDFDYADTHTTRLETQLYSQTEDVARLQKELTVAMKANSDLETKLADETRHFENEKSRWQKMEQDLREHLKQFTNQKSPAARRRQESYRKGEIYFDIDADLATSASALDISREDRSDSYSVAPVSHQANGASNKTIEKLTKDLESTKLLSNDQLTQIQEQAQRIEQLEQELANVKSVCLGLQEDNESYQLLLQERTMSGEFSLDSLTQASMSRKETGEQLRSSKGLNLAAELDILGERQSIEDTTKIKEENKKLQDENKALTLYINKILIRIMENKSLEAILSIDSPERSREPTKLSPSARRDDVKAENGLQVDDKATKVQRRQTVASPINLSLWNRAPKGDPEPNEEDPKFLSPSTPKRTSSTRYRSTNTQPVISPSDAAEARRLRRHTSMMQDKDPKSSSTWLKRMSTMGWSEQ